MAKILVVDDDEDVRTALDLRLLVAGHRVEVAEDGEAAVAVAQRFRPDLILIDHLMPVMDGRAAVAALRANGHAGPICAITASTFRGDTDHQSFIALCDHVLTKPFGADLEERLTAILQGE
jgi:two-component system OmpR family response regulator